MFLLHDIVDWSVVCDCGIYWSYSLFVSKLQISVVVDSLCIVGHVVCGRSVFGLRFIIHYFMAF